MNAPLIQTTIPSLAMREEELIAVLQTSVYPGASIESIKLVLGWCKAQDKDPMKKPCHIVPMRTKMKLADGKTKWVERDTIMAGINDYRTDAARSDAYIGLSEPEFGPFVEEALGGEEYEYDDDNGNKRMGKNPIAKMRYPEWCKIIVRRLVKERVAEFPAVEYWRENYATKNKNTTCPNEMWTRRPIGQLVKCTEAQALRKAFPELGGAPTAEEMEGKTIEPEGVVIDSAPAKTAVVVAQPRGKSEKTDSTPTAERVTDQPPAQPASTNEQQAAAQNAEPGPLISASALRVFNAKLKQAGYDNPFRVCAMFNVDTPEQLPMAKMNDALAWLAANPARAE